MSWSTDVERLAHVLKGLISWGAKPHLVMAHRELREHIAQQYPGERSNYVLAQAIIEELKGVAGALPRPEAECVRCLLGLTRRWDRDSADARRSWVIEQLGLDMTPQTFRRRGAELALMRQCAELLLGGLEEDTA